MRAAEGTRVEFADGNLLVKTPKLRPGHRIARRLDDVTIELQAGSHRGAAASADFRAKAGSATAG